MKKTFGMLAFVFTLCALTSLVLAQQQRQGGQGQGQGFGGGGETRFMLTEEGQKDLGLSSDDVTKIRELLRPAAPGGQRNQNATPEERRAATEAAAAETAKKLAEFLSAAQLEKVQTRAFQLGGYAGLSGRYAQAALNLTDDQKAKIAGIARENRPQGQAGGPGGGQNFQNMSQAERDQMRSRAEENRRVLGEKFKEVLTAEQKAKADDLLKEIPAYIKEIQERPAGFGAGGAGGGNRGGGGGGGRNR